MRMVLMGAVIAALGLLSLQTWLTWSSRHEPTRAAVEARRLAACADLGAAAADFLSKANIARREAARGPLGVRTFETLRDAPREVNRSVFAGRYLLPRDMSDDLDLMQDVAQKSVNAAFQGDGDRMQRLIDDFETATQAVQSGCREMVEAGRFAPS